MPPVFVDPAKVREFEDRQAFWDWLAANHATADELWIKLHKKDSGLRSIHVKDALDVVLCWGWIDAIRKSHDDRSFLQRYTPRGKKSIWSQINRDHVSRLIAAGEMQPAGLRQIELAKADGRWDAAYASARTMELPDELLAAIEAEPAAFEMLQRLTAQNRFALAFRVHNLKTEEGRRKRIAAFVEMLKRGETIYPNGKSK